MLIDLLCWVGLIIVILFGICLIAALAIAIAFVIHDDRYH